ncbi:hypothetical protein BU25DRAFT_419322 [Macroventuria anomochaeta]|uniref:Uncharacterized protein n=1 Tax=Macroventuria anomochaeta TaxID=301207 RepID=A0ACB6S9W6_9PLEO|nr:uncharacterized protein BU25DRAFT_419322 [Macroventuria anomochaeta]KAF2630312.1 hypothetical protein BU25DRAFT_419322 [Macroventuria anomochaeta]
MPQDADLHFKPLWGSTTTLQPPHPDTENTYEGDTLNHVTMGKEVDDVNLSIHSVDGPCAPNRSRTWGNDVVETRSRNWSWAWTWGFRDRWISACRTTELVMSPAVRSAEQTMQAAFSAIWCFICHNVWPFLVRVFTAKKQWFAFFMFISCAVVPMVTLGYFTPRPEFAVGTWPPYYNVFAAKYMSCGNYIDDRPANSTVTGFEGLFVLDQTWGRFSFSTVKTIDVAWDILVGRGLQLLAWWVAYVVFSDALLRVIERHPASFRIFQRIALEGPSLTSLWTLCKELLSVNSKRTKTLFAYILLSTSYVLCIPMFLGAMTGYDSTSIAWLDLDNSNNIVPTSAVKYAWVITGTSNSTFDEPICADSGDYTIQSAYMYSRMSHCTCQMPNGTLAPPGTFWSFKSFELLKQEDQWNAAGTPCLFNYPGSNDTWQETKYDSETGRYSKNVTYNCNETVTYKINDYQYDVQILNATNAYCYDHKAYNLMDLQGKSRCLPDTANPSYQWGFSTMLSGIFVFIHFGWGVSMYILWLDAQSKSTLIQEGYELTPLRAAFAIAKAVKRKTGLGERQLVRHDTKDLNKELYGIGKEKGTNIDYSIFAANIEENAKEEKGVRRRRALALDGLPS